MVSLYDCCSIFCEKKCCWHYLYLLFKCFRFEFWISHFLCSNYPVQLVKCNNMYYEYWTKDFITYDEIFKCRYVLPDWNLYCCLTLVTSDTGLCWVRGWVHNTLGYSRYRGWSLKGRRLSKYKTKVKCRRMSQLRKIFLAVYTADDVCSVLPSRASVALICKITR